MKKDTFIYTYALLMLKMLKSKKRMPRRILLNGKSVMCVMRLWNFMITTYARTVEKR